MLESSSRMRSFLGSSWVLRGDLCKPAEGKTGARTGLNLSISISILSETEGVFSLRVTLGSLGTSRALYKYRPFTINCTCLQPPLPLCSPGKCDAVLWKRTYALTSRPTGSTDESIKRVIVYVSASSCLPAVVFITGNITVIKGLMHWVLSHWCDTQKLDMLTTYWIWQSDTHC